MPSPRPTGAQTGRHAHAHAHARARSRSGFTLLELLVVTAILAILASLLLAAAGRPAALARDAICRHHLRQWGLATRTYADDHDDHLPPEGFPNPGDRHTNRGWYIQLPSWILFRIYLRRVFGVPRTLLLRNLALAVNNLEQLARFDLSVLNRSLIRYFVVPIKQSTTNQSNR
jgi:prepilin-type N-terminal cleavage/methylation domain-containing protein